MTLSQKLIGTGFLATIGALLHQPGLKECGVDQMLTTVLPQALGVVAAGAAGNVFSDYAKEHLEGSNKTIVWPSDAVLNHHLRKIVSTTIAGIIDQVSIQCPAEDHLSLTAFCLRLESAWQMTAGLNSHTAAALAETEISLLVSGGLQSLSDKRPLDQSEWRSLLQALIILCNDDKGPQICLSEDSLKVLSEELEENFVTALFSALCHEGPDADAAFKKVQILKLSEVSDQLAKRFAGLSDQIKDLLEEHQAHVRKVEERLDSIHSQLSLASTPPSKVFPVATQTGGISDFWFHSEWTTFQGRVKEYGALKEFLNGDGSSNGFRWSVLLGQAGSGKSRIALQLGRDSEALLALDKPGGWQMLYLESPRGKDQFNGWEEWMPAFPTLIVIDYAASRREDIWQIIKVLARRSKQGGPSKLPQPVRVLLLERSAAKALLEIGFNKLEDEPEFSYISSSHHKFSGDDLLQGKLKPLYLPPLDDLTLSRLLYQTYEERGGKGMSRHPVVYVDHLKEIQGDSRPLFAMLLGTRLAEDPSATDLKPRELAERLLKLEHARWERYRVDHPELDEKLLHLLTLVCVCRELEAKKAIGTGLSFMPATEPVEDLARMVFSWGGGYQDGLFSSLQPDFLRELYVLLRLNKGAFHLTEGENKVKDNTKVLLEEAYAADELNPDESFYFNALQNFPDLAQSEGFLKFKGAPPSGQVLALRLLGMIADEDFLGAGRLVFDFRPAFESALSSSDEASRRIIASALAQATATYDTNAPKALVHKIFKTVSANGAQIMKEQSVTIVNLLVDKTLSSSDRQGLVKEIKELWEESKDPEVRLAYAQAAVNAIKPDMTPDVRQGLVKEIKELWEESKDPEVRLRYAKAAYNAIEPDMTPDVRQGLVKEIKELWEESKDPELRLEYAKAAYNAIEPDMTPDVRQGLVKEIKELWEESKDPELRLRYAQAAYNAIKPDMTPDVRQGLVKEIKELWEESKDPKVRLAYAQAGLNDFICGLQSGTVDQAALDSFADIGQHILENVEIPAWQDVVGTFAQIVQFLQSQNKE